ncbi:hypothetical protein Acr_00g0020440 [Actinidia rufa]|uniref:Uncharacterized protein n=1 Tax=Actinidia rufa TaxID=165716 RepID=A0A7J0DC13_9ERIC|nr:hypothetical protein Acr_00g0020440 [Actinidia rufa]
MADKVTRLPSSPREDLPSPEGSPSIDAPPPLERETNTMTHGELDHLRESCSFPSSIQIRLPEVDKTIMSTCSGRRVSSTQWCYGNITSSPLSPIEFRNLFDLFKYPKPDSGWLYFKARPMKTLLKGYPNNVKGGRRNSSSSRGTTKSSPQGYLEKLGFQGSQDYGAPQSFALDFRNIAASGRDNAEDKSAGSAAQVVGDEVSPTILEMTLLSYVKEDQFEEEARLDDRGIQACHPGNKCLEEGAHATAKSKGTSSKAARLNVSMLDNPAMAEKLLEGVIPPADKEEVEKLDLDRAILKFFHIISQAMVLRSSLARLGREIREEAMTQQALGLFWLRAVEELKKTNEDHDAAVARFEKEVADLKDKSVLAKKSAIEEYKSSDDFQEVVEQVTSKYFGEGFNLYKKQIGRLHPDLDIQDMGIDAELTEEEEEEEEKGEEGEEKGEIDNSISPH